MMLVRRYVLFRVTSTRAAKGAPVLPNRHHEATLMTAAAPTTR